MKNRWKLGDYIFTYNSTEENDSDDILVKENIKINGNKSSKPIYSIKSKDFKTVLYQKPSKITASYSLPTVNCCGLTKSGTDYYTVDKLDGTIYKLDKDFKIVSSKVIAPTNYANIKSIVWDGTYLWAYVAVTAILLKLDVNGNTLATYNFSSNQSAKSIESMTYNNGNLIGLNSQGILFSINTTTGTLSTLYTLDTSILNNYYSIYFDGAYYWYYDTNKQKIAIMDGKTSTQKLYSYIDIVLYNLQGFVYDATANLLYFVSNGKVYALKPNLVNIRLKELEDKIKFGTVIMENDLGIRKKMIIKSMNVERVNSDDARYNVTISGVFIKQ